jgi:predicted alpha/beta superfamily hydrolase
VIGLARSGRSVAFALFLIGCVADADPVAQPPPAAAAAVTPPKASTALPNVHVLPAMTIPGLDRQRVVRVYLPPGYERSARRYPVVYLHDGQNLFDAATGFAGEWEVDESLDRLARTQHLELIAVGIDNGGEHRLQELTAWDNAKYGKAEGAQYMAFVVDVVKPYIDAHYRTLPDRTHTAIAGSSLGGLISHYALCRYPQVFGKAALFSPSYWYAPEAYAWTDAHRIAPATRIYFYAGDAEDEHMVGNMQRMAALLRRDGLPQRDLRVRVVHGAHHNEAAWRAEFPRAMLWLFGTRGGAR